MADECERATAEIDATFAVTADALIVVDAAGRVTRINPPASRLLSDGSFDPSLSVDERFARLMIFRPDGRPVPPSDQPTWRALTGETVRGASLQIETVSGRRISVLVGAMPIRAANGEIVGAVTTITDLSRLHELQEEREEYAHSISHDLRGPLTVILGQAQLIQRAADRAEVARRGADAIATSARRMNVMIQDLVDSARLDTGHLKLNRLSIDVPAVAASLRDRLPGASQRVVVEPAPNLPPVLVDPARLERILVTLIGNALKYSMAPSLVRVNFRLEHGCVVTAVADEGRGILPEDQPHLFERYFRGHNVNEAREGLGLGLYITKGLIEAQGGRIWFESAPGRGTTFWFTLPIAESAQAPGRPNAQEAPSKPHAA